MKISFAEKFHFFDSHLFCMICTKKAFRRVNSLLCKKPFKVELLENRRKFVALLFDVSFLVMVIRDSRVLLVNEASKEKRVQMVFLDHLVHQDFKDPLVQKVGLKLAEKNAVKELFLLLIKLGLL